jgi:hypothetical protein
LSPSGAGQFGPACEVRTYLLEPTGPAPTIAAWRKAVPGRVKISPVLAAMPSEFAGAVLADEVGRMSMEVVADHRRR